MKKTQYLTTMALIALIAAPTMSACSADDSVSNPKADSGSTATASSTATATATPDAGTTVSNTATATSTATATNIAACTYSKQTIECVCPGGVKGAQTCQAVNGPVGDCACPTNTATVTVSTTATSTATMTNIAACTYAKQTIECVCPGGVKGAQTCQAQNGPVGDCACPSTSTATATATATNTATGGLPACTNALVNQTITAACPNGTAGCSYTCELVGSSAAVYQWSAAVYPTTTGGLPACTNALVSQTLTATCPNGTAGCSYTCELVATGNAYQWSAAVYPSTCTGCNCNASCNSNSCTISNLNTTIACPCPNGASTCTTTCQFASGAYNWTACGTNNLCWNGTAVYTCGSNTNGTCSSTDTTRSCDCGNGSVNCTQSCLYANGAYNWSSCSGGGTGTGTAYVSCSLTNASYDYGTVTVSGDVLDNLFQTGSVYEVCLVGDSLGGWSGNRTHCQPYGSGYSYTWTGLNFPSSVNRFTFIGVTSGGSERWSNNSALVRSGTCGWDSTSQLYFAN